MNGGVTVNAYEYILVKCISYYGTAIVEDYAGYITGVAQDSILSRGKMTLNSGVIREKRQRLGAVRGMHCNYQRVFCTPNDPNPACETEGKR